MATGAAVATGFTLATGTPVMAQAPAQIKARSTQAKQPSTPGASNQSSHANRTDAQALDIATSESPELFEAQISKTLLLRSGERVERWIGDRAAKVESAGRTYIVESTVPLRARDKSGDLAPVDLAPAPTARGFALANPLVDVELPAGADGMFRIGRFVKARLIGADGDGRVAGPQVFWANALLDTDVMAVPLPTGLELLWQLRSANSPRELAIDLEIPAGASLSAERDSEGRVEGPIQIVRNKTVLVTLLAASALDANNQSVPAYYRLDGTRVTTVIEPTAEHAHPLVVDPPIVESTFNPNPDSPTGTMLDTRGWRRVAVGTALSNFSFVPNQDDPANGGGCPVTATATLPNTLCVGSFAGLNYPLSFGEWTWRPPNGRVIAGTDAYLSRMDLRSAYYENVGSNAYFLAGLFSPTTNNWIGTFGGPGSGGGNNPFTLTTPNSSFYRTYCMPPAGNPPTECSAEQTSASVDGTFGVFGVGVGGTNAGGVATAQGAAFWQSDRSAPVIAIAASWNQSTWYRTGNLALSVGGTDRGMGMSAVGIVVPGAGVQNSANPSSTTSGNCTATRHNPCDMTHSATFGIDAATVSEGTNSIAAIAIDPIGRASQNLPVLRIDRTAPPTPDVVLDANGENSLKATWSGVSDPTATDGTASGVAGYRSRYRTNSGAWTSWVTHGPSVRESAGSPTGIAGTVIEFQVTSFDGAGNESAAASQTATLDGDLPDLFTSGALSDADGGYVRAGPVTISATGEDESGVERLKLLDSAGGLLDEEVVPCAAGVCPSTATRELVADLTSAAEGPVNLAVTAVDGLLNESLPEDIEVFVDKTAPPAPTSVRQLTSISEANTYIGWAIGNDPNIDSETVGSGVAPVRYRWRTLLGDWTAWQQSDNGLAEVTALPADVLTIELQSFDQVGNASPVVTQTVLMLPEDLLLDTSPNPDDPSVRAQLASPEDYAYQDDFDGETRAASTAEDDAIQAQTASFSHTCSLHLRSPITKEYVPEETRNFKTRRDKLVGHAGLFCTAPLLEGQGPIDRVEGRLSIAYLVGDDLSATQAIGKRKHFDISGPSEGRFPINRMVPIPGRFANLCNPRVSGQKRFVIYGSVAIHTTRNTISRLRISKQETVLDCPSAKVREARDSAAFRRLAKYSIVPGDNQIRSPSRQLRIAMPSQPYARSDIKRPWDAHHVIPWRSKYSKAVRAVAYRCHFHPNEITNGAWLRGLGLRKTQNGKKTPAFRDLEQHAPLDARRAFHPDTYKLLYYTLLQQRTQDIIDATRNNYCRRLVEDPPHGIDPIPDRAPAFRSRIWDAKGLLEISEFGVEHPDH